MHIVVNGFFLGKSKTGIGQYLLHILRHLLPETPHQWTLLVPEELRDSLPEDLESFIRDRIVFLKPLKKGDSLLTTILWEKFTLPNYVSSLKADVVWSPSFAVSTFPKNIRSVMTIHDVIPWKLPEYTASWKRRAYNRLLESVAKAPNLEVITISEFSQDEITEVLGIPSNRITVTPLASSKDTRNVDTSKVPEYPYIVYVGGLEQRKNVDNLLKAIVQAKHSAPDIRLIVTGKYSPHPLITPVPDLIQTYGLESNVTLSGYISDAELTGLIQEARALIYPSTYEGFGLPILEGMALSTPVITSSIGVMREVAGDAAELVDPHNVSDMARGILSVWEDESYRHELVKKGSVRVQEFRWERTAKLTLQVLEGNKAVS